MRPFRANLTHPARATHQAAFSLIEVVVAIGIASFALIPIVALLPTGLKSAGGSVDESRAVNLLSSIVADRQASPYAIPSKFYSLPALTNTLTQPVTASFGITDQAHPTGGDLSKARYRVTCVVTPPIPGRSDPYQIWIRVTWPALSTNSSVAAVETVATFPQP